MRRPPIRHAMRQLLAALGPWDAGVRRRCATASLLLRRLPDVPTSRDVARYRKIRRWFGASAACVALQMLPADRPASP